MSKKQHFLCKITDLLIGDCSLMAAATFAHLLLLLPNLGDGSFDRIAYQILHTKGRMSGMKTIAVACTSNFFQKHRDDKDVRDADSLQKLELFLLKLWMLIRSFNEVPTKSSINSIKKGDCAWYNSVSRMENVLGKMQDKFGKYTLLEKVFKRVFRWLSSRFLCHILYLYQQIRRWYMDNTYWPIIGWNLAKFWQSMHLYTG